MRVLVVGAAVSGRAAAVLLEGQGHEVVVYDRDAGAINGLRAERHAGAWDQQLLGEIDLVVASPGVPEHSTPLVDARSAGVPVWSEIELAARSIEAPIGAVTATNGKTTVTEIADLCLRRSGLRSAAVGNIGDPLSGVVGSTWDALVVEASSFQLRFIDTFHPAAAVLLNVAPDHLDWHGSFDAYLEAKARIHENQGPGDTLIYDADDPGAVRAVSGAASRRVPVSATSVPPDGAGVGGGSLHIGETVLPLESLWRSDPAMLVDLAAGGTLALALGATPEGVADAVVEYRPGRHRRELVATLGGVQFVDDSKATNPHAALASIESFASVVLIAGGRDKGLDVSVLGAADEVRHVVAIGEAATEVLSKARTGSRAGDMADAVAEAARVARPGDTVLLAPGCASFDMFSSYAERGDSFAAAVRRLTGAA